MATSPPASKPAPPSADGDDAVSVTPVDGRSKRVPKYMLVPPTRLPNGLEVSIHRCPRMLQRELDVVMPGRPGGPWDAALAVTTCQHAATDLVRTGPDVEKEKDACLETFASWARAACANLKARGHWADFIDPCSGMPMLQGAGAAVYSEVDGCQLLLRYKAMNAGCCKVLLHPVWGSAVYPATLFTTAPLYDAEAAAMGELPPEDTTADAVAAVPSAPSSFWDSKPSAA